MKTLQIEFQFIGLIEKSVEEMRFLRVIFKKARRTLEPKFCNSQKLEIITF